MAARPPRSFFQGPENEDELSSEAMHTISFDEAVSNHVTGTDGQFQATRVTTTVAPVVVRQHAIPGGAPRYQEASGYSFLFNSPKYPGLCAMDDGTLVLTLTVALTGEVVVQEEDGIVRTFVDEGTRDDVILSSHDGVEWSQPVAIPGYRTTPMNLGGDRLLLRGWTSKMDVPETFVLWFSSDRGKTWSEAEDVAPLPDGRRVITDVSPNMLIEGDLVHWLFMVESLPDSDWGAETCLRTYNHVTHSWKEPFFFPEAWIRFGRTSEASLCRAGNGDMVASFRSGRPGPSQLPADKWRGLVTATSADDGRSWSDPVVHSLYAHVHSSLLRLADDRILLTYAVRLGEIDGQLYHGHEAVLSHDHGQTFDWAHRFVLFRGTDGAMHSPQSVQLPLSPGTADPRILTVVMHPISYTWRGDEDAQTTGTANLTGLSNVSCVVWSPGDRSPGAVLPPSCLVGGARL